VKRKLADEIDAVVLGRRNRRIRVARTQARGRRYVLLRPRGAAGRNVLRKAWMIQREGVYPYGFPARFRRDACATAAIDTIDAALPSVGTARSALFPLEVLAAFASRTPRPDRANSIPALIEHCVRRA